MNSLAANFKNFGILSIGAIVLASPLRAAQSVSQYGITWTFSEDRPTGQFANGDWWVQLPVTIANITPATVGSSDSSKPGHYGGSMINPTPGETNGLSLGGSVATAAYDAAKNVGLHLPFPISKECSLVSTVAQPDYAGQQSFFKEVAVLTCLTAVPAVGSFRPPFAGSDKTIQPNWNLSSMSYAPFRKLSPPIAANIPDRRWLEAATVRPLFEYETTFNNTIWKAASPEFPSRGYGRAVANISAAAGVYLNLNVADETKKRLLINMCQWGIDVNGLLNAGMRWYPLGGHMIGRKLPLFIAAKALGDESMLKNCNPAHITAFAEDWSHRFIQQSDIDTMRVPSLLEPFTQAMLGMPEWGPGVWEYQHHTPQWSSATGTVQDYQHNFGYRFINGGPNTGEVLCVSLMGGRVDYGNEAYFQYIIDRYYPRQKMYGGGAVPAYSDNIQNIVVDLWDRYLFPKNSAPLPPTGLRVIR